MKKRGMAMAYIITLIILLIGFAILLFVYFRLDLRKNTEKQICYNSVMKSIILVGISELDCSTNYLCISGGGKCGEFNPTSTVKVDSDNREEIIKALADEMADCWWMFNEYYDPEKEKIFKENSCALCSVVRFDERILEKNYKISYREALEYFVRTNKTESQTYFEYLYGSSDVNDFVNDGGVFAIGLDNNYILDDDEYVIVAGRRKGEHFLAKKLIIHPSYLKSSQISFLECKDFVTRA